MALPERTRGRLVCVAAYAAALAAAALVAWALRDWSLLANAAAADVAATLVVFAFSRAHDNSSLYDAYWSVAPPLLGTYWALAGSGADGARQALVLALVVAWAARLTWNWARGWRGLAHEDWRYADLRRTTGRLYWPASLLGLHLMPTAMVLLGCLPLHAATALPARPLGALDALAALVTGAAIWIEATADAQLHRFVRERASGAELLESGLWAWSRHPNYFGEVLFWWGLSLFGLAAVPERWWVLVGPVAITGLFLFVSIPLIDRHMLARHPGYAARRRRVSALLPWFPGAEP